MKEKAIYIGAVILTAIWGVAAPEGFASFLLGFELLLALSMWILVQILAGKVEIVPEPAEETVGKKEPIVLRVKLKNASLLPASCVAVTVSWRDPLDNSTGTVESMGMAGGKRTGVLEFYIPVKYSGVYEFWIQSAFVRDWLRLWSKKLLITDKKVQVLSVPLVHQAEEWIPPGTARLRRGFGSAFPKKGRGRWIGGIRGSCLSGWRSAAESALEADCKDRRNAGAGIQPAEAGGAFAAGGSVSSASGKVGSL